MIVTSIGSRFKLDDAYAPLVGFSHTVGVATICASTTKKILKLDGSFDVKNVLNMNFALDHRYIDGALGAKIIREMNVFFNEPFKYLD